MHIDLHAVEAPTIRLKKSTLRIPSTSPVIATLLLFLITGAFGQEGRLIRTELFSIPTGSVGSASGYTFRIAVDSKENIAFNACARPVIFFYTPGGQLTDSVELPSTKCVRSLEYDEYDKLLVMDNDEQRIFRYDHVTKKLETLPYKSPEDWFRLLNHYFKAFDIPSIPTYYSNNDYLQDFYFTRFSHSYNLYLNYKNGHIYQVHYNLIKMIRNRKSYVDMTKSDIWLSDNITPKSKLLLVDDERKAVVYYDRFYNLIYENTTVGFSVVNAALASGSEPARFDYCTNIQQEKIFGVSAFNKKQITISSWKLR